jgi:uncharacterized membrane protein
VSGLRLFIGFLVMGIVVPLTIFLLLAQHTVSQFLTIAATTFLSWGVADLLATVLARPRLQNRSPQQALREDWDRRSKE